MKYKLGDKVRIHDCEGNSNYNGEIGTIVQTGRQHPRWHYLCSFDDAENCPFGVAEMTKVVTKGQQLLFSFME